MIRILFVITLTITHGCSQYNTKTESFEHGENSISRVDSTLTKEPINRNQVAIEGIHMDCPAHFIIAKLGSPDSSVVDTTDGLLKKVIWYYSSNEIHLTLEKNELFGFVIRNNSLHLEFPDIVIGVQCDNLRKYCPDACEYPHRTSDKRYSSFHVPVWNNGITLDEGLDFELDNDTLITISYSEKI